METLTYTHKGVVYNYTIPGKRVRVQKPNRKERRQQALCNNPIGHPRSATAEIIERTNHLVMMELLFDE